MRRSRQLLTCAPVLVLCGVLLGWQTPARAQPGNPAKGKKLYLTYCFLCHGTSGKGDGFAAAVQPVKPRDLANDAYMSARTDQQLFDAISGGGPAGHSSMVMPHWGETLTKAQIWDLVAYVRTLHRPPPFQGNAAHGQALFDQYCWTCHGKDGKGDGPIAVAYGPRPRDLTNHTYLSQRTDYDLYNAISQGGAAVDLSASMPAWGHVFKEQELWDLVAYVRQLSKQP
jgi:cytochrome c oxidase cbb3-type subunit 3